MGRKKFSYENHFLFKQRRMKSKNNQKLTYTGCTLGALRDNDAGEMYATADKIVHRAASANIEYIIFYNVK